MVTKEYRSGYRKAENRALKLFKARFPEEWEAMLVEETSDVRTQQTKVTWKASKVPKLF